MFKFPKTLYFAISDLTAIPLKRPADFDKVGATAAPSTLILTDISTQPPVSDPSCSDFASVGESGI